MRCEKRPRPAVGSGFGSLGHFTLGRWNITVGYYIDDTATYEAVTITSVVASLLYENVRRSPESLNLSHGPNLP